LGKDGGRDGAPGRSGGHAAPSRVLRAVVEQWETSLDPAAAGRLAPLRTRVDATDDVSDPARQWALADWMMRMATPVWLDAAGLSDQAAALRGLDALSGRPSADAAGATLDTVAGELAEQVPAAVPSPARPVVAAQLARAR